MQTASERLLCVRRIIRAVSAAAKPNFRHGGQTDLASAIGRGGAKSPGNAR
jgi:hypothetical protein